MYADESMIKIKHEVLYEVAKLAWAGELEAKRDNIAVELIPGPQAKFRCCIYNEREIIRQSVRLAEGKSAGPVDDGNVIQVISSACEDCPISSYTVTENCQNCLGKACINACKFGAIEPGRTRSHIDPTKCKECGKCAQACPYNAIAHLPVSYTHLDVYKRQPSGGVPGGHPYQSGAGKALRAGLPDGKIRGHTGRDTAVYFLPGAVGIKGRYFNPPAASASAQALWGQGNPADSMLACGEVGSNDGGLAILRGCSIMGID